MSMHTFGIHDKNCATCIDTIGNWINKILHHLTPMKTQENLRLLISNPRIPDYLFCQETPMAEESLPRKVDRANKLGLRFRPSNSKLETRNYLRVMLIIF